MANTVAPNQQVDNFIPDSFFETLDKAQKYLAELNNAADKLYELGIKTYIYIDANCFYSTDKKCEPPQSMPLQRRHYLFTDDGELCYVDEDKVIAVTVGKAQITVHKPSPQTNHNASE